MARRTELTLEAAETEMASAIYKAALMFETFEHQGKCLGNGHHAAQRMVRIAIVELRRRWHDKQEALKREGENPIPICDTFYPDSFRHDVLDKKDRRIRLFCLHDETNHGCVFTDAEHARRYLKAIASEDKEAAFSCMSHSDAFIIQIVIPEECDRCEHVQPIGMSNGIVLKTLTLTQYLEMSDEDIANL